MHQPFEGIVILVSFVPSSYVVSSAAERQDVDLPVDFEETVSLEMRHIQTDKTTHSRQTRSLKKYTVEVLLVVDQQMVRRRNFRSTAQARDYALALGNLVSPHTQALVLTLLVHLSLDDAVL